MLKELIIAIYLFGIISNAIAFEFEDNDGQVLIKYRRSFMNKCVNDKDCKVNEYCDHHWPNPIGSCKVGKDNGGSCIMDRHCASKVCHLLTCRRKRPVKDGPCVKHDECITEQYCEGKSKQKCMDRHCSGWCTHDYECLSNNCHLLRCKRTDACKKTKRDQEISYHFY